MTATCQHVVAFEGEPCGEPVTMPAKGRPPKRCDNCQRDIVRRYDDARAEAGAGPVACVVCEKWEGYSRRRDTVTCSVACRKALSRAVNNTDLL